MKPSERHWPAQQAPDDFADRVMRVGLHAARADVAALESRARVEPTVHRAWGGLKPAGKGRQNAGFSSTFRHAAFASGVAVFFLLGAVGLYLTKSKPEADAEQHETVLPASSPGSTDAALAEAREEVARQAREVVALRARVSALEDDRAPAELKANVAAAVAEQAKVQSRAKVRSPRPAASLPACNCAPGDALCTCL